MGERRHQHAERQTLLRVSRGQALLACFGEHLTHPCGHCDRCAAGEGEVAPVEGPFPVHSTVRHATWGEGMVLRYEEDRMVVLFDEVGYKTLGIDIIEEQHLLEKVA